MFKWLKSLFARKKKKTDEVVVHFKLPDGKLIDVTAIRPPEYKDTHPKCKLHWEYQGISVPTNNCNMCWEYYAQKVKR